MTRMIYVYLTLIVLMASIATGIPFDVLPELQNPAKVTKTAAPAAETATMAAQDPALLAPDGSAPDGSAPDGSSPDGSAPDGSAASALNEIFAPTAANGAALSHPMVRGGSAAMEQTSAQILAELGVLAPGAAEPQTALEGMSRDAIGALRALRGLGDTQAPASLENLVAAALQNGKSDAYIDALVNEAAGQGQISVPAEMVTAEGRVDTAVLLASLISKAKEAKGVRLARAPLEAGAGQSYSVRSGDSLGAIALRLYGDSKYFSVIFDANRATLASPDVLVVGQELTVPAAVAP